MEAPGGDFQPKHTAAIAIKILANMGARHPKGPQPSGFGVSNSG